jgi:hypothetical protein
MSDNVYSAAVQGLETIDKNVFLSVKTKTVKSWDKGKEKKSPIFLPTSANEPSIEDLDSDDLNDDDVLELGDGQLLTYKKYKSLSTHSCGFCNRKLTVEHVQNYAMAPGSNYLLCEDCSIELICDTQSFKDKFFAKQGLNY